MSQVLVLCCKVSLNSNQIVPGYFHLNPVKIGKIKKMANVNMNVGKKAYSFTADVCRNWYILYGKLYGSFSEARKIHTT